MTVRTDTDNSRSLGRLIRPLLVSGLAVSAIVQLVAGIRDNQMLDHLDFGVFYRSAQCIFANCDRFAIRPGHGANLNPPFIHYIFVPFLAVPMTHAFWLWTAVCLWLIATTVVIAWRAVPTAALDWRVFALTLTASTLFLTQLVWGQIAPVISVSLALMWMADRRGGKWRPLLLAPLVAWKPFLGVLGITRARTFRAAALCLVSALLVFGVDALIEGVSVYRGWFEAVQHSVTIPNALDASVWSFMDRALASLSARRPVHVTSFILSGVLGGLIVAITAWRARSLTTDACWLMSLTAGLLASPKGWTYYGLCLIPSGIGLWSAADRRQRGLLTAGVILECFPTFALLDAHGSLMSVLTYESCPFWAYVCFWVAAAISPSMDDEHTSAIKKRPDERAQVGD